MKILVLCPGSFVHEEVFTGLDSPERGEGRWAQNYARMLALAGHEVYAASGGLKEGEVREHYGVRIIDQAETECQKYEPYDLYMDAAWWEDKKIKAKASKYIILKWALEGYLRQKPLPDNQFLAYPYPSHHWQFIGAANSHKTFALPTMFGLSMPKPNWEASKVFLPGKIDKSRGCEEYLPAIASFLRGYPIEACSKSLFEEQFAGQIDFGLEGSNWWEKAPYDKTLEAMRRCRISLPILNPGAIIEAAFQGVPSVFWEHGGFYNSIGQLLDLNIPHGAPPERFTEVAESLMNSRKKHFEATRAIQGFFACHVYDQAIGYFDLMAESIF